MLLIHPLDAAFPIERQLEIDASPVVLMNVFTLEQGDEEAFLEIWRDDAAFMKRQSGFNIYAALSRHRRQPDLCQPRGLGLHRRFRAAFTHPDFQAKLSAYPSSAVASPHLFHKVAVPGVCVA